jgi:hypothetical protein
MPPDGSDPSTWFNIPVRPLGSTPRFIDPFVKYGGDGARIRVIFPDRGLLNRLNPNGLYVMATSAGNDGEKQLSPFLLGPCRLYGDTTSKTMENAWQYSKVYRHHVGTDGEPTPEYFEWARNGFAASEAVRHPMGKEAKAAFYW